MGQPFFANGDGDDLAVFGIDNQLNSGLVEPWRGCNEKGIIL